MSRKHSMRWLLSNDRIFDGLTISALFSGSRGLGTRPGRVSYDVMSGRILYSTVPLSAQVPVVRRVDKAIRWITLLAMEALYDFVNPYPLDSVIHSLSNWALEEYTWVPANCHRNLGGRGGWYPRIDCYPIHGQQQYSKPLRGWKAGISSGWMGHLERVQLFLKWNICIVSMMWCSLPLMDCHCLTQCKKCRYCKYV